MFVKFTDKKGRDVWVNPLHVKIVAPAGPSAADLYFTHGSWGTGSYIRVRTAPDEAALALSAAMPPIAFVPDDSEEDARRKQSAPAASA